MIKLYYTPNQAKTSPLSLSLGTFAFLNPHGPKETPAGTELPRLRAALRWFIWVYMCIKHFMCALKTVWFCLQWILGLSLLALVSSMLMEQCANGGGNIGIPSRNNSWYTCTSCKRRILGSGVMCSWSIPDLAGEMHLELPLAVVVSDDLGPGAGKLGFLKSNHTGPYSTDSE